MKTARNFILFFLVLILQFAARGLVRAQAAEVQFFPETGHSVRGEFLRFYRSPGDPNLVYGYPITEQMISRDGKTVQYFQRARFELAADASGMPQIQLTAVGSLLYTPGQPQTVNNQQACQFFSATGYSVCFQFLDFHRAHGGLAQFGNPISPLELQNNVLVQSFEKARFEWRTDGFRGRVVPTDLGRIYFDMVGEDAAQRNPVDPSDAAINPVLSIKVRAYVAKPVSRPSGDQTIFVIVRSQTNQAVADAKGTAVITLTDGTPLVIQFVTDSRGMAQVAFNFNSQKAGEIVPIEISATYLTLSANTKTSFLIWF